MYVLAAVVADPLECDVIRDKLKDLRRGRQPRIHWSSEDPRRKSRIVTAVADLDVAAIVAVGTPVEKSKQERARGCCLERLLFEMQQLEVSQVWLEARTESLNRRDRRLVEALRGRRMITSALRVDIGYPLAEPMLWLPDAVAGAVTAARRGEARWLAAIEQLVTIIDLDVC